MKRIFLILLAVGLVTMVTMCESEYEPEISDFPSNPDAVTDNPDEGGGSGTGSGGSSGKEWNGKPCFIWIDCSANFPDFANSQANITRDLTLAADAGFSAVVVDVRPTDGDVLFKSSHCNQVEWEGAWVSGVYSKITRTATWDYLQCFIDEGHKLGLKVYAGFNTFVGGTTSSIGNKGVMYRDDSMSALGTYVNTGSGIVNIMNSGSFSTKFFNPADPDAQEYVISLLEDLAAYGDLDGIILDRCRFDSLQADFSDYTRKQFESYIGTKLSSWPGDVMPAGHSSGVPAPVPTYFKSWLEYRAKVTHDFMETARARVKAVNSAIDFGVYVGGWYSTYYEYGVNWASPNYDPSTSYSSWASASYKKYGFADLMDVMIIGAYAGPGSVYGSSEWTMQGFCSLAMDKTKGEAGLLVGGPDVGNWDTDDAYTQQQENEAITASVTACGNACDGYFLFDMIHLKQSDQWSYVKAGIQELNPTN